MVLPYNPLAMSAHPDSSPTQASDNAPNLEVIVRGAVYYFHCNSCREFWKHTSPNDHDPCNHCISKTAASIRQQFKAEMGIPHRDITKSKWNKIWKLIKHVLEVKNDEEWVCVIKFIRMTLWFGCLEKNDESCFCLDHMQIVLRHAGSRIDGRFVCWFAGYMSQNDAEALLQREGIEANTFLVRFSEGGQDEGWFAVAIKTPDSNVLHYNIKGKPSDTVGEQEYNGRFQLVLEAEGEGEYPNLVQIVNRRLKEDGIEIEGGQKIFCRITCPELQLNSTFKGYER